MAKIFVCDDEQIILDLTRTILERDGHEIHASTWPHDAYELLRDSLKDHKTKEIPIYNLLLTDYEMRGSQTVNGEVLDNGISLAKVLHRVDPKLPIVMMSGRLVEMRTIEDQNSERLGYVSSLKQHQKEYFLPIITELSFRRSAELGGIETYLAKMAEFSAKRGIELGVPNANIVAGLSKPFSVKDIGKVIEHLYRV